MPSKGDNIAQLLKRGPVGIINGQIFIFGILKRVAGVERLEQSASHGYRITRFGLDDQPGQMEQGTLVNQPAPASIRQAATEGGQLTGIDQRLIGIDPGGNRTAAT